MYSLRTVSQFGYKTYASNIFFRSVNKSFNGKNLNVDDVPQCEPAPESLEFTPPISDRVLKVAKVHVL